METLTCFLQVGLLVVWLGSPGASGYSIEKPGVCPQTPYFCSLHEPYCHEDSDCPGEQKCCHVLCGMVCKSPTKVKPGVCPMDKLIVCLKPRLSQCKHDFDCPRYQKCCSSKCGNSCEDP